MSLRGKVEILLGLDGIPNRLSVCRESISRYIDLVLRLKNITFIFRINEPSLVRQQSKGIPVSKQLDLGGPLSLSPFEVRERCELKIEEVMYGRGSEFSWLKEVSIQRT